MKTIVFTGNTDKRILVLPLVKGLASLGEVLLVTDDPNYLRATDEKSRLGPVQVMLIGKGEYSNDLIAKYDDGVDYMYIVWDTREFIPEKHESLTVCRHKDRRLTPESVIDTIDELNKNGEVVTPSHEVVITSFVDKKELKKVRYTERGEHTEVLGKAELLELKISDFKWLKLCEETGNFITMKNAAVVSTVAKVTCEAVGMSEKEWEAVIAL